MSKSQGTGICGFLRSLVQNLHNPKFWILRDDLEGLKKYQHEASVVLNHQKDHVHLVCIQYERGNIYKMNVQYTGNC
jgi:hypothetical protein